MFSIAGDNVSGSDFSDATVPVRVFNREFVADTVFPTEGEVAPIFVLGKENVEKQKRVAQLKTALVEEQAKLNTNRQNVSSASSDLDRFCVEKAKAIKDSLRSSGTNPYNDYNKSMFSRRAEKMIAAAEKAAHMLDDEERDSLLAWLRSSPKAKLQLLTCRLPDLEALEISVATLVSTTVVSAAIGSLKDDAELSSWVHTGMGLHQARDSAKCLYCDQQIPKDRLSALEAHFSSEYDDLLRTLSDQITTIQDSIAETTDLTDPNAAEFYDDLASEFKSAKTALRSEFDSAKGVLESLLRALEDKKTCAFDSVELEVTIPKLDDGIVDRLNGVIRKHNQACDEFQTRIDSARTRLEANSVAGNLDELVKLGSDVDTARAEVARVEEETRRLTREIEILEREIVEHRQPAEEFNEDLCKYLGHGELRLEVRDTGYIIMRHDAPARSLSEGETTAIALLYFLKSLQDRRFELSKGVVVLDDPVSSLDANALYLAFGFIRHHSEGAGQLFIFTHNFTFFRLVRNWFHHFKGQNKKNVDLRPARFYMLDCIRDENRRCSSLRPLDPLLEQYESEYHYLFARVYRRASAAKSESLEDSYIFPNMARRLLEAFLAFRQPDKSGGLWQKVRGMKFDEARKLRILRFLHTHSHGNTIGEPEHDPSLLGEVDSVLKDLLDFIKDQDSDHFAAMVTLVDSREDDEGTSEAKL